jgi:hypothetical protein
MKSKIALAALIAVAAGAPAFAQQKASVAPKQTHIFAAPMPKPATPGPGKLAAAPGTQSPKSAPPTGLYHYRVPAIDQAGNAAAPKLIDDFATRPKPQARANPDWAAHK